MPAGGCPRKKVLRPGMTKTQMMRVAQTSAIVQKEPKEPPPPRRSACPSRSRTGLAKVGPPPACPRKVDFAAPAMTRAMEMRQKASTERARLCDERQRMEETRRPRCSAAPVGGDARFGRASRSSRKPPEQALAELEEAIERGHIATRRRPPEAALDRAISRGHVRRSRGPTTTACPPPPCPPPPCPRPACPPPPCPPPPCPKSKRPTAGRRCPPPIPEETRELARMMNADVVQAVPISDGPVNKIIIDPGAVCPERSTIVSIPCPEAPPKGCDAANKSIEAINESLDEQDAAESAAIQCKLEDLQNARRELVIAVASVGGNTTNLGDEQSGDSILDLDECPGLEYMPSPPRERTIYRVPDISHVMFQVQYGRDHPDVEAARKFSRRAQRTLDEYANQKRIEDEFERAATSQIHEFNLEIPLQQDFQDGDMSCDEDEYGTVMPRIKASMRIPVRTESCPAERGADIDELCRFVDLKNYPPEVSHGPRPPPGRENLNPDLWTLDDPWYHEPPPPDDSPLIRFDSSC